MMRRLPLFMFVAALVGAHPAAFANDCARSAESPAFHVAELKSELMVTAISCKQQDRYNAFIGRYKGDIAADEKLLNSYFNRSYGRQGQKQHDEYVTNLANIQAQQGLKMGTAFCSERTPMFDEVMALQSSEDLPGYALGKNLATPVAMTICTSEPVPEKPSRRKAVRKIAHKH